MNIALLGHRGVPNAYGGFETFAEELSTRLTELGYRVVCYCRTNYYTERPHRYKGVVLVYLHTLPWKSFNTLYHTFASALHMIYNNTADIAIVVNVGNAPAALLLKLFGKKVVLCVDGLDWQRKKWGPVARLYLWACSYLAPYAAHRVVTDAASVHDWYKSVRGVESIMIPYGTDSADDVYDPEVLKKYGLSPKKYFIYVARFEPEYNPSYVVQEFVRAKSPYPLVMVGDNNTNPEYVQRLRALALKANVIFTGTVFGTAYKTLLKDSLAYIRAAEVGGASPAVIEAMGRGVCVVANDKAENREMLGDHGMYYMLQHAPSSLHDRTKFLYPQLSQALRFIIQRPQEARVRGAQLELRAKRLYTWDHITEEYETLCKSFITPPRMPCILITGAGGMLGKELYDYFSSNFRVVATDIRLTSHYISYLDVRKAREYEARVAIMKPDYIFHLAAITSLEQCEQERANAIATNATSVKYAAKIAKKYGAKLVYISSAGVFDGKAHWYTEQHEPKPINVYGFTKYCGELLAQQYAPDALVVRSGWMMGGGESRDKKFVAAIVKQIIEGAKEIYAVNDKYGTPTYGYDFARNLEVLLAHNARGIYHMVCGGSASRYDMAKEIVKILGYEGSIMVTPVTSSYFKTIYSSPRPRYENLRNARMDAEGLNRMQGWHHCLRQYLEREFAYAKNPATQKLSLSLKFQIPSAKL